MSAANRYCRVERWTIRNRHPNAHKRTSLWLPVWARQWRPTPRSCWSPEIKITETTMKRVKNGKTYLIQASEQASGIPRRATPGFLQAADPGADRERAATGYV